MTLTLLISFARCLQLQEHGGFSIPPELDLATEAATAFFSAHCERLGVTCSEPRTTARLIDKLTEHLLEPGAYRIHASMLQYTMLSYAIQC